MTDLTPLLQSRSVAVVGASEKEGNFGKLIIENLQKIGFEGTIAPVHPKGGIVGGLDCVTDIASLPDNLDNAIIALGSHHSEASITAIAEKGIPAAVVFADPNVGRGRDPELEGRVAAIARAADLAMLGMNGMGYYSLHHNLAVSGYDVPSSLTTGGIALTSHSGTVFDTITQSPRLAFNYAISGGNESVITETDYLEFFLTDPTTTVIGLYLETVRQPERFMAALAEANRRGIPVVAFKVGTSKKGAAMAAAHTGALAGGPEAYAAVFRRYGVHQTDDLEEMVNTLDLLSTVDRVPDGGLGVVMDSGGERSMFTDLADELNVPLTELTEPTLQAMREGMEPGKQPDNPVDAFGSSHLIVENFSHVFESFDADPNVDVLVLCVDFQREATYPLEYLDALESVAPKSPVVGILNLPEVLNPDALERLGSLEIPMLRGTRSGIASLRHLIAPTTLPWSPFEVGRPRAPIIADWKYRIVNLDGPMDEASSKQLLSAYGIPIPAGGKTSSKEEALALAAELSYPLVAKTMTGGITHKSDGGVIVGIENDEELVAAFAQLEQLGPDVLIERMTSFDHELILGVTQDDQFGPIVVLGMGGIYAEILDDTASCVAPMSVDEAARMTRSLKGAPILQGARGQAPVSIETVIDMTLRLATLSFDFADVIGAIDVNSLAVREHSATALDALVIPL